MSTQTSKQSYFNKKLLNQTQTSMSLLMITGIKSQIDNSISGTLPTFAFK